MRHRQPCPGATQLGYDVVATDRSEDMLRRAAAEGRGSSAASAVRPVDMLETGSIPGTFDAGVCLFDSLGYVRTNDNVGGSSPGFAESWSTVGFFCSNSGTPLP